MASRPEVSAASFRGAAASAAEEQRVGVGIEQVGARQQQERARAHDRVLAVEQQCRDGVVDNQRRLVDGRNASTGSSGRLAKGCRDEKNTQHHTQRQALARLRRIRVEQERGRSVLGISSMAEDMPLAIVRV